MVLSEIATGARGRTAVALVDVLMVYFHAPSCRIVFVELPPEDYQVRDKHCCRLLQHSSYGTRDSTQNWEEELASTLSNLNMTRGIRCPCVRRGYIKHEDVVATVHRDAITI